MSLAKQSLIRCVIYRLSLSMVLIGVLASYPLADISIAQGIVGPQYLGSLTVIQFCFTSIFMLLAWWGAPKSNTLRHFRWLLFVAIISRLILIPVAPYTSNDVDRYLFDGRIALAGYDPYQMSHNADELKTLKNEWSPPEEHANYVTIYPPLALGLFSLSAMAGVDKAHLVWKLLVTVASILTVLLMVLILKKSERLFHLPLIGLSPLLIFESGIGMHIDAFSALMVTSVIYFLQKNKITWAGSFIGLGGLIKILPVLLLLPLFFGLRKWSEKIQLVIGCGLVISSGYLIAFIIGLLPLGSLPVFFAKWRFGSPLFYFAEPMFTAQTLLLSIVGIALLSCLMIAYYSRKFSFAEKFSYKSALFQWSLMLPLLVSPVVFPWYLLPLVPFLALSPRPFLLVWVCLLPLTYEVLGGFACCRVWLPEKWPLFVLLTGLGTAFFVELFPLIKKRMARSGRLNKVFRLT